MKYAGLIRFRLSAAVSFSALTGFLIYGMHAGSGILLPVAGVFLLASGASVLNQVSEQPEDSRMKRTMNRPLPLHVIKPQQAILFSACLIAAGTLLLLLTGLIPALLGLLNIVLYNFIYTPLKKYTSLAIIPGAAVGAIPPLIGFTAAGGKSLTAGIILFSLFMFLWQLPHFWLIIIKYREDYQRAGFKIISGDDHKIRNLVFFWVLTSSALLLFFITRNLILNTWLLSLFIPANVLFILLFYQILYKNPVIAGTQKAFVLINTFGLLIMLLFIINTFLTVS